MKTRTTICLAPELLKAAKKKAIEEGRTLTSLIEEGLRHVLQAPTTIAPQHGRRFKVRVSKASGGLLPGFDLTNMATIYEAEDEELFPDLFQK